MEINDFLDIQLLESKFVAVKGYGPVADRETDAIVTYRVNISLQDEKSPFYMEMISVKIKTTSPTISIDGMKVNMTRDVDLSDGFRIAIKDIEYCYDVPQKVSLVDFCNSLLFS